MVQYTTTHAHLQFGGQRSKVIPDHHDSQELSIVGLCTYVDPGVENLWLQ